MADSAFGEYDDVAVDAKQTPESIAFSEELYSSDIFRMFCFKVLPCCKLYNHNWKTCPFLHEGEKAGRRDPQKVRYVGIECQDAKKGECSRGDSCPYAHNLFEFWLHPSRYRTQLCNKPSTCRRKVCFFAHDIKELRHPTISDSDAPIWISHSLDSENGHTPKSADDLQEAYENRHRNFSPVPVGKIPRSVSAPYPPPVRPSPPSSSTSDLNGSGRPSPRESVLSMTAPPLKKSYSTLCSNLDQTPTPARMSPMIPAYRESFASETEDSESLFHLLPDDMCLGTKEFCKRAFVWDLGSSVLGSLANSYSLSQDGDA